MNKDQIISAIKESGYRINFISEKTGLSYPHLTLVLTGKRNTSDRVLSRLQAFIEAYVPGKK